MSARSPSVQIVVLWLGALGAAAAGCVDLTRPGGLRPCSRRGTCAAGFTCGSDRLCHPSGPASDAGDGPAGDRPSLDSHADDGHDVPPPSDGSDAGPEGDAGDTVSDGGDGEMPVDAPMPLRPNGAPCTDAAGCVSGSCVDRVCCDTACLEPCAACNVAGLAGVCAPVPAATDPDGDCADEGVAGCGLDGLCDGAGSCRKHPAGTLCAAASCTGSTRTLASRCDGAGACVPGEAQSCAPYLCDATDCRTSCADDGACLPPRMCAAGSCGKKPLGAACAAADDCESGLCEQGTCCSTACASICRSCAIAGSAGACIPVPASQDPLDHCAAVGADTCGLDGTCDGAGSCRQHPAGTVCKDASCTGETFTAVSRCDGTGTCKPAPTASCGPYVCGAAACKVTCAADADCDARSYCRDAACVGKDMPGAACAGPASCASGFCADGVCCESVCDGACLACAVARTSQQSGLCRPVRAGTDPDDECEQVAQATCDRDGTCNGAGACRSWVAGTACDVPSCSGTTYVPERACDGAGACNPVTTSSCAPYACDATACKAACAGDMDCASGFYCAGSACVGRRANGSSCSDGPASQQCASGFCVDGFCCESACAGACLACAVARTGQASGLCRGVTAGTDPDAECAEEVTATCGRDGQCDGSGDCRRWVAGTMCAGPSCSGSTLTPPRTCDGAGACNAVSTLSCLPFACGDAACRTSCTNSADCAGSNYCASMACVPKKANGAGCSTAVECALGHCVDGFCCESACAGLCSACSLARTAQANGLCRPVVDGTDPDDECTPEALATCGRDGTCDGAGACRRHAAGTACAAESCAGATYTPPRTCDGAGTCNTVSTVSCAPYACDATACKMSCATSGDCAATFLCSGTVCGTTKANGAACGAGAECTSGHCVDGVCCETACGGFCMACSNAKTAQAGGLCRPVAAGADPDDECAGAAASTCMQDGTCNGSGACRLWPSGTECVAESCATATYTPPRTCNGIGVCNTVSTSSCFPYLCSGTACRITCSMTSHCDPAHYCSGTQCVPKKATGTACGNNAECSTGFCIEGFCCENDCAGACMACSSARTGQSNGLCRAVTAGTDPDSECSTQAASTCGRDGFCDGGGACRLWAVGTVCVAPTCASGMQTPARTCNGSGICQSVMSSSCTPYACGPTACKAACATDVDCVSATTHYCAAGSCLPKKPDGAVCGGGGECASGSCVDGVCCETSCTAACMACSNAKTGQTDGLCRGVAAGTDPDAECVPEAVSTCGRDGFCDGGGGCRRWAAGTQCAAATCSVATYTPARACDGAGVCSAAAPVSCGPYVCDAGGGACRTACSTGTDCLGPAICVGTTCTTELACNNDTAGCAPSDRGSRIAVAASAGTTYYLFVESGPTAPSGSQTWNPLTFTPPTVTLNGGPAGSGCATTAATIDPVGGIYTGTTAGGPNNRAMGCGVSAPGSEAVYKIIPHLSGNWTFSLVAPALGTAHMFLNSSCTSGGACMGNSNFPIVMNDTLTAGQAHYVVIDGQLSGAYTLTVTPPAKSVGVGTCGSPSVLQSGGGKYSGATGSTNAYAGSCSAAGKPENVLSWTPTVSGTWTIETCGGPLDSVLYVRTTCP